MASTSVEQDATRPRTSRSLRRLTNLTTAAYDPIWTPDELNAFLENPKGYAPGTKMAYRGMNDIEDRANLIAYLDSLDD